MSRKQIVGRFHLFGLGVLAAITAVAFYKISAEAGLPVHWGFNGKPDRIWPRDTALAIFPATAIVFVLIFAAIGQFAPVERIEPGRRIWELLLTSLLGLLCALQFAFVLIGVGSEVDLIRLLSFAVALALLALGVVVLRAPPGVYHGLHLPWTINSRVYWVAVHRVTGSLMALAGLVLGAVAILQPTPEELLVTMLAAVLAPGVLGALYGGILSLRR